MEQTKYFIKGVAREDDPDFEDETVYYCEWCKQEEFLGTLHIGKECENCKRRIMYIEEDE